jgi:hypothetical protein
VFRAVVPPLVALYVVFVAMVLVSGRRPVARPRGVGTTSVALGDLARMVVGGYVVFLAIVLVFHVWLAGERESLVDAVWGGAFLALIAATAAAVSSVLTRTSRRS